MLKERICGISMFSGAGVAETYLADINIDIQLANELVPVRADYYKHFYPDVEMVVGDIQSHDIYDLYLSKAKALNPKFLLATPPCQGMSSLGKKNYADDKRNNLIFSVLNIVDELDLDVIVIENVPKFLKLQFPYKGGFARITEILKDKYGGVYNIQECEVNAKDYGVAQSRPRAILLLYKECVSWELPDTMPEITLREAIGHLPSLKNGECSDILYHSCLNHSDMQIECLSHTPEGCSAMNNPVYFPKKADGEKVSGFHNTYKRMRWDAPCPARATNSGLMSGHNNVHPGRLQPDGTYSDARVLSLLELFIVSSLPTDWNLPVGYKDSFVRTVIGEAIPPLLLKNILSTLEYGTTMEKHATPVTSVDYTNKKEKWTVMKYVEDFDLLLDYLQLIIKFHYQIDDATIDKINADMQRRGKYRPLRKASRDTTEFKIRQICYDMFAYRADRQSIVVTPLCRLLLDNRNNPEYRGKIVATMWANLPFNHPYNKMSGSFNIYPFRLIFRLLLEPRLEGRLYQDEVFYLVAWMKEVDEAAYTRLVDDILALREMTGAQKLSMFKHRLPVEDSLANMLHETDYLFGQLSSACVVSVTKGEKIGTLCHGGFGRNPIPEFLTEEEKKNYSPTGRRSYTDTFIELQPYMKDYIGRLLDDFKFTDKPHTLLAELGNTDYILTLYNFYPQILIEEINVESTTRKRMDHISQMVDNIYRLSGNPEKGDCYRFEDILSDAFNEFSDVRAEKIAKSGTIDIECIYLPINEKFDVEARSTKLKLTSVNAGRLLSHRQKACSNYTLIVTPRFVPSVLYDIAGSDNVILTVPSLCNFLFQEAINKSEISYAPLRDIITKAKGKDISRNVDEYVAAKYGISKWAPGTKSM